MEPLYVIDNIARRSFEADINTVIVLIKRPADISPHLPFTNKSPQPPFAKGGQGGILKFIAFKKPFDEVIKPETILEIENIKERTVTENFRISPKDRKELLIEGIEIPEQGEEIGAIHELPLQKDLIRMPYSGNKWGGKYLRAPDIYWTILEKNKDKLVSIEPFIGEILTVSWSRQGRNDQIMVKKDSIKKTEKVIPVLKSPREFDGIVITSSDATTYLRIGLVDKRQIVRTPLVWDDIRGERHICRLNQDMLAFTHNFHGIRVNDDKSIWLVCACLNSTLTWLFIEILGRRGLGGGGVRILVEDMKNTPLLIHPEQFDEAKRKALKFAFGKVASRPVLSVRDEISADENGVFHPKSDRRELDNIVFDILGLTQGERDAVYEAVIELVRQRLEKAKSI
jgi:hypothetical protein